MPDPLTTALSGIRKEATEAARLAEGLGGLDEDGPVALLRTRLRAVAMLAGNRVGGPERSGRSGLREVRSRVTVLLGEVGALDLGTARGTMDGHLAAMLGHVGDVLEDLSADAPMP